MQEWDFQNSVASEGINKSACWGRGGGILVCLTFIYIYEMQEWDLQNSVAMEGINLLQNKLI